MAADFKKKKENPTGESMRTIDSHINKGSYSKCYLLFGVEAYLVHQYRDKLLAALVSDGDNMNFTRYDSDTFDLKAVEGDAVTLPFLAEHRVVLVEESGLFNKGDADVAGIIDQMPSENVLIFCESDVDKRKKSFTSLKKKEDVSTLEFFSPDSDMIYKWLSAKLSAGGMKVRATVPDRLVNAVVTKEDMKKNYKNMYMLANEADKLHDYCLSKGTITDEDVDLVCVNTVEDKIFDMCEAISRRDSAAAIKMYNDLMLLKAKPYYVIALVSREYGQLVQISELIKEGKGSGEIAKAVGVPPFAIGRKIGIVKNYTSKGLLRQLDRCQDADLAIKSGRLTETNAAENLILNLLG